MQLYLIDSIRTNNFNDEQMIEKVKTMWKEASHRLSEYNNCVYGVYHDYESDYKGDYSLGIGIEEHGTPTIDISTATLYKIFPVDNTDEQGILKAWKKIWELEEAGTLKRAYTIDYEKYYPNGEIEIFIAIK